MRKGKEYFFKSEYKGLKLYFPQTKVVIEFVLFSSEILTASVVQQKEELRLGEGVINFQFPEAQ